MASFMDGMELVRLFENPRGIAVVCFTLAVCTFALVLSSHGTDATDVASDITQDTTWDPAGNPYHIKANVNVADSAILIISPGVRVLFDGAYTISCSGTGRIEAKGDVSHGILFTTSDPYPTSGKWRSIYSGIGGSFSNCTFEYGLNSLIAQDDALVTNCSFKSLLVAVHVMGDDVSVLGCTGDTVDDTVYVTGARARVANCTAIDNHVAGFHLDGAERCMVEDCNSRGCHDGVRIEHRTGNSTITRCTTEVCSYLGIRFGADGVGNSIIDCTVNNSPWGLYLTNAGTGRVTNTDLFVYRVRIRSCGNAGIYVNNMMTSGPIAIERCLVKFSNNGIQVDQTRYLSIFECTLWMNSVGLSWDAWDGYGGRVYWNNFVNNTVQARVENYGPVFERDGKGNYYSDYKGVDANHDGIGDTSYPIPIHQDVDPHPLMGMYDVDVPVAEAGEDRTTRQHEHFEVDASNSTDDVWIANYTWTIDVPGPDIVAYESNTWMRVHQAGRFNVTLRVRDFVGHVGTDWFTLTVLDVEPPTIGMDDLPQVATTGDELNFSLAISDNVGVEAAYLTYRFGQSAATRLDLVCADGGTWFANIGVPSEMRLALAIVVTARDAGGNTNVTKEITVPVVDDDMPAISGQWTGSPTTGEAVDIRCTAWDNWDMDRVTAECTFPGLEPILVPMSSTGESWYGRLTVPGSARSPLSVVFNATDGSGNEARSPPLVVVVRDNDPPTLVTDLPADVTVGGTAVLNCSSSDNWEVADVLAEYWYAGGNHTVGTPVRDGQVWRLVVDIPLSARTPLTVLFTSIDDSGNEARSEESEILVRDVVVPTLVSSRLPDRFNKGATVPIEAVLEDNVGIADAYVEVKTGNHDWVQYPMELEGSAYRADVDIPTDEGQVMYYRFRATDAAANTLLTEAVRVDLLSQKPFIVTVPVEEAFRNVPYSLAMMATDPDTPSGELVWSLESNASWLSIDSTTGMISGTPTGRDLGRYSVSATVVDGKGGVATLAFELTVLYINLPPGISISFPSPGQKVGSSLRVNGTATDDEGSVLWVRVRVDRGEWKDAVGNSSWSLSLSTKGLSSGEHSLEVVAFDGANVSEPVSTTFTVPEPDGSIIPGLDIVCVTVALVVLAALRVRRRG